MNPKDFHMNTNKDREVDKEGDISDIFARQTESNEGSFDQNRLATWEPSKSFVSAEQPWNRGQSDSSKYPTLNLSGQELRKSDAERKNYEEGTEGIRTTVHSSYTDKESAGLQETTVRGTANLWNDTAVERRRKLEAVIGAAKERATRSGLNSSTLGETSFRQTEAFGGASQERSERPKLTARAIRERLAASKYASFRTRSTAGSSVSSATSLPFSRLLEDRSPGVSHSPVTSRRPPVLDARSTVGLASNNNASTHESFTWSVEDKIRSADDLLAKLEMNTTSSSLHRDISRGQGCNEEQQGNNEERQGSNEEQQVAYNSSEMSNRSEFILDSRASSAQKPEGNIIYNETKQEAEPILINSPEAVHKVEGTNSYEFANLGGISTSDDLASIFETKESLDLEFSTFNEPAQLDPIGNTEQEVKQEFFSNQGGFELPQEASHEEYGKEFQVYLSQPGGNMSTDHYFNSRNDENSALIPEPLPASSTDDLSNIFQDEGHNNVSSLLSAPESYSVDSSSSFNREVTAVGFDYPFGVSQGQDTFGRYPPRDITSWTFSHGLQQEPMSIKDETKPAQSIDAGRIEDDGEQNFSQVPLDSDPTFPPPVSGVVSHPSFEAVGNKTHSYSDMIFPEKHAIVCFSPNGHLLASFPQIIPGFRVWNGREYVEDTSSIVVKPGALSIVPFMDMVEDTEERCFECIRSLREDSLYNLSTESMRMFCHKMASECKRRSEGLLWSILEVLSCHSKEEDWKSLCIQLKTMLKTWQNEDSAFRSADVCKGENVNHLKMHSFENILSKSSGLEAVVQGAIETESWSVALTLSRLVSSSVREQVTRKFVQNHVQESPLFRFLILLANDIVPNVSDLEGVSWMAAMNVLIECEARYREKGLLAFGDYLSNHQSDIFASHCCYVLAKSPICSERIFGSRLWWEEKDLRMLLVGADPRRSIRACLTSVPSIIRTLFYSFLKENQLSIVLSPFLLYLAYVLVEAGRLILAKHLSGFLVERAHALLKSSDPNLVSEAQRLTAVYYSYLEQLDNRLNKMLPDESNEQGEGGVSLTRSLSKVFRSITKTGSKKNLRPRSSSNSSWESFAAAAVSIIAPAEETDPTPSTKPRRNSNAVSSLESSALESKSSSVSSPIPAKNAAVREHSPVQGHFSPKQNIELMNERPSPAESPNRDNIVHAKVAASPQPNEGDPGYSSVRTDRRDTEDKSKHTQNESHNGFDSASHEKKHSSRRSLSSFLMEKLTKIAGPKQANLGKENKFYYDEKLGRWVCEDGDESNEEVPPPPPSRPSDGSQHSSHVKEPEEIRDDMHRAMSRRRWSARARYVDTFGQGDQVSGTKPPLVVPPSVATRQVLKTDTSQPSYTMFTPSASPGGDNNDWGTSMYLESNVNNVSDTTGTNN